jgi:hypothetical protein
LALPARKPFSAGSRRQRTISRLGWLRATTGSLNWRRRREEYLRVDRVEDGLPLVLERRLGRIEAVVDGGHLLASLGVDDVEDHPPAVAARLDAVELHEEEGVVCSRDTCFHRPSMTRCSMSSRTWEACEPPTRQTTEWMSAP